MTRREQEVETGGAVSGRAHRSIYVFFPYDFFANAVFFTDVYFGIPSYNFNMRTVEYNRESRKHARSMVDLGDVLSLAAFCLLATLFAILILGNVVPA